MSDADFYRFTVKCDRAGFHRIERLAREAGLSSGVYVQKFFDAIVAGDRRPAPAQAPVRERQSGAVGPNSPEKKAELAARCDELHCLLDCLPRTGEGLTAFKLAGEGGIAERLGQAYSTVSSTLRRLIADGRVARIVSRHGGRGAVSLFKVEPFGEAAP